MTLSAKHLLIESGRFFRFGMVGIAATAVYAIVAFSSVEIAGASPVLASIIGQVAAMSVSYFGHAIYSFTVKLDHGTYLWRFLVIAAFTFGMNAFVTWLLTGVVGMPHRAVLVIVMVMIPILNYLCNRFWVFLPGLEAAHSSAAAPSRRTPLNHD
jgi:putative flippase GtrA